jgi:hypothetical protein
MASPFVTPLFAGASAERALLCTVAALRASLDASQMIKQARSADAPANKGVTKGEAMSDGSSRKKASAQNVV